MSTILLASTNPKKIKEISTMLASAGLEEDFSLLELGTYGPLPKIKETANTFEGNARLKARKILEFTSHQSWILADDSGLCVDALGGRPGVVSARYAGPHATDADRCAKILAELEQAPDDDRGARFVCSLVFIHPSYGEHVFTGILRGTIAKEARGDQGFGYDPIFIPVNYQKTFGELNPGVKNQISHRAIALGKLIDFLRDYPYPY